MNDRRRLTLADLTRRPRRGRASWPSRRCSIRRRRCCRTGGAIWSACRAPNWRRRLAAIGEAPFRAKQLWHWIYHQGVTDFSRDVARSRGRCRQKLAERFVIGRPRSRDGADQRRTTTRKFLFRFRDGQEAETVYIPDPEEDRGAVCISSQVGCTLSCRFCHTGTQTLVRNLGAAEIVGQFMAARDCLWRVAVARRARRRGCCPPSC